MVVGGFADFVDGLVAPVLVSAWTMAMSLGFLAAMASMTVCLIEDFSPGHFQFFDRPAATSGDVGHAATEYTIDADEDFVAGLDEVGEDGLHAGGTGSAHDHRHFILGAEDVAESGGFHP